MYFALIVCYVTKSKLIVIIYSQNLFNYKRGTHTHTPHAHTSTHMYKYGIITITITSIINNYFINLTYF